MRICLQAKDGYGRWFTLARRECSPDDEAKVRAALELEAQRWSAVYPISTMRVEVERPKRAPAPAAAVVDVPE